MRAPLVACLTLVTALVAGLASWALGPGGRPASSAPSAAETAGLSALQADVHALL